MTLAKLLREVVEPLPDVASMTLGPLLERLDQSRVELFWAATQGTSWSSPRERSQSVGWES